MYLINVHNASPPLQSILDCDLLLPTFCAKSSLKLPINNIRYLLLHETVDRLRGLKKRAPQFFNIGSSISTNPERAKS